MTYAPPQMNSDCEVLDYVKRHLLTQGVKAVIPDPDITGETRCVYRTPDHLMCAAGCLISDVEYATWLEGRSVATTEVHQAITRSLGFSPSLQLLRQLQNVHDRRPAHMWSQIFAENVDPSTGEPFYTYEPTEDRIYP